MAAIRKLSNNSMLSSHHCSRPTSLIPAIFISCRGVAYKLFIKGLSFSTTEQGLTEAFSRYGEVIAADIPKNKESNQSKGYGFVTFATVDEAENALEEMNGKPLDGRHVSISYARPGSSRRLEMPVARGPPEPAPEKSTT